MLKQAHALTEELIEWRRDFHMHPETGFEVQRTAGIVADELEKLGYRVRREVGKTGFHVITPLRLAHSGALLLVNRGWIPADAAGEPTPAPVPVGPVAPKGEAEIPSAPALVLHGGRDAARAWGGRWPYLTLDLFEATVEDPVQPVIMLLDPGVPDGFVRHWTRPVPNVWMHQGYAGQWFGFALIALALYLRLSLERTSSPESP